MCAYLPSLGTINTAREMIGQFGGYNRAPRIGANEFCDTRNLGSDEYPLLAPRKRRGRVRQFVKPNGLFAHERLCWVDGTDFYYNGEIVGTVSDSPKQFVGMGAYVLIWPDKKYYNTATDEFGSLGNTVTTSGTVTASMCKLDGTALGEYTVAATAPEEVTDGDMWLDTSVTPNVLKQYSATFGTWSPIPTTYVKIAAPGIGAGFAELDGVSISGFTNAALNGAFFLAAVGADYVVVTALIDAVATQAEAVTIERKIPDMDYVTESDNRVWGCSSANHEIYACAQGDPKNWNRFLNVATDSYAMTVGSAGDFTGCITHLGYVLFFKADVIHKIYGNKPSNYQLTSTHCRGVEAGSERSLIIVNETLYYKSRHDVCAYNAALPESVSAALGNDRFSGAVAGARGGKYYISMQGDTGAWSLLVYDTARGLWHREDNTHALYFAALGGELFFIDADDKCLYSVGGTLTVCPDANAALEGPLSWMAQTGDIGLDSPDNKYISKLQVRLEVGDGAIVRMEIQYDQETAWEEKCRVNLTRKASFTVPIIPRRCDTMRLRFVGTGDCRVFSITKTIEEGSEL